MQRIGAAFRASLRSRGVTGILPTDIGEMRSLRKGETHNELKDWHGWYCVGELELRLPLLGGESL